MRVQIVSFHCVLKNKLGQLISSSFNQDVVTSPTDSDETQLLPALADALSRLKNGQREKISIAAKDAYGYYQPSLRFNLLRKRLRGGARLKVGSHLHAKLGNDGAVRRFRVTDATLTHVTLDANHPLAGQDLEFDVQMVSSKESLE